MDWINHIKLNLQTHKSELVYLTDEAAALKLLENNTDGFGLMKMINLLSKLKSFPMQDSLYEHFSLIENIVEVLGSISRKAKEMFIISVAENFLDVVINPIPFYSIKMEVLRLLNLFLEDTSQQIHQQILKSQESIVKLETLLQDVSVAGDIELQSMMIECLFRFYPTKVSRTKAFRHVITDPELLSAFLDIRGNKFEVDCRNFLNKLNAQNEAGHRRVVSLPAEYIKLDGEKLLKPSEDGYDDFWIDFNTGSKRISVFCQPFLLSSQLTQGEGRWETLSLRAKDVQKFDCRASGKNWKIAVELKNNAQIFTRPGSEDQSHLLICGIKLMYNAKSAVVATLGGKASTVNTPLQIFKRTDDDSESMVIVNHVDQVSTSKFSSQEHKNTSKKCAHGLQKAKSSVPCNPMFYAASSTISQASDDSSSWNRFNIQHDADKSLTNHKQAKIDEDQSLNILPKTVAYNTESKDSRVSKKLKMTHQIEISDKKQKLYPDNISEETSEKAPKQPEKNSVKECGTLPKGKKSFGDNVCQKQKAKCCSGVAQNMMVHHPSPMTPGGDGFCLSITEPKSKKISSNPLTFVSKPCNSVTTEEANAMSNKTSEGWGDLPGIKMKSKNQSHDEKGLITKSSDDQGQRYRNTKPALRFEWEEYHSTAADIIPDSLPSQALPLSKKLGNSHDSKTTTKSSKNKAKTTLRDVLGLGNVSKDWPSSCGKYQKSKSNQLVELDKPKPIITHNSTKCPKTKTNVQKNKRKTPDGSTRAKSTLDNKGLHLSSPKKSGILSPDRQVQNTSEANDQYSSFKSNAPQIHLSSPTSSSKPESSKSELLYIEIDHTTKARPYKENYDDAIDESQNETSPLLAAERETCNSTKQKTTLKWLRQECKNQNENESHFSSQFFDRDHLKTKSKNKYKSSMINSSCVFETNSKNKRLAQEPDLPASLNKHTAPSCMVSKNDVREPSRKLYPSKKENKLGTTMTKFSSKNRNHSSLAHADETKKAQEKVSGEEKPRRAMRQRKSINYNESELFNQSLYKNVKESPHEPDKAERKKQLKKQNEKHVLPSSRYFPSHLPYVGYNESETVTGGISQISKCKESWQKMNKPIRKEKQAITIKHSREEMVRSSFTTNKHCTNPADPYDFDFECKIRSKEIQHFIPYKSWLFYSPAVEIKEPQISSQEDKHRESKKSNVMKSIIRQSQTSCQKKISFNDSMKSTQITRKKDSGLNYQKDRSENSNSKQEKMQDVDMNNRGYSPCLFESQEQRSHRGRKSPGYFIEPDSPKSSESGLRFPPLQDYAPDSPYMDNDFTTDKDNLCEISASARSELSWLKEKKQLTDKWEKQRGKTYGHIKDCDFPHQKQISDEENDEIDEALDTLSCSSMITEKSLSQENTSPLGKPSFGSGRMLLSKDSDSHSSDKMDALEHNIGKQNFGSSKKTLSSFLNESDAELEDVTTGKLSVVGNSSFKKQESPDLINSQTEIEEDLDSQEDCAALMSPKLSMGESSQHLSNLSFKFEHLFQEVMSKVSGGDTSLYNETESLNPVSRIVSGPSSKERLTKSALKRKYPSSSVSFSDDLGQQKTKNSSSKVVKRQLFMPETESKLKRRCTDSIICMATSPIVSINLSPVTSPLTRFSKSSSGSNMSVDPSQPFPSLSKPARAKGNYFNQNDSDVSEASSEMTFEMSPNKAKFSNSYLSKSVDYDMKNQLKNVFKSVCHTLKPPNLTEDDKRKKAFNVFEESLQSIYSKMKETDQELKRSETNSALLWHQQSQKMKRYRLLQEQSIEHIRKAFETFKNQVHVSETGENNLKKSMKLSLSKDFADLKKKLRAKYNAQSLEAIKHCLQASMMLS